MNLLFRYSYGHSYGQSIFESVLLDTPPFKN